MLTLLGYAIPSLIVIAVALGLAFACVLQYRVMAKASPELRLVVIVLAVGLGALLSVALTTRELDDTKNSGILMYDDLAGGFAASRWLSLFVVAASFVEIARGWVENRLCAASDPARPLLLTMLAYYLGTVLIQAVASDHPEFSPRNLYLPVLLAAVWYQRPASLAPVIGAARLVILALTAGSLACIALRPDFVLHRPDPGVIPGIDWRLYGLTPHANAIGPIALLGILIELRVPSRWRPLRWLALASSTAVLVLAQSKTTWSTIPLMVVGVWMPLQVMRTPDGPDPARQFRRSVLTLTGFLLALALLAAFAAAFDVAGYVEHRADLLSLTGRTRIWDITLHAWRDNVLFGYGPEIWGLERRAEFGMYYVGHAHNQFVQTLGEAGVVSLVLLLGYLGTLLAFALRSLSASRGFVLMLLMLVLVRCVTEAPMRSEGILSWSAFLHALLMAVAVHHARQPRLALRGARQTRPRERGQALVRQVGAEVALRG